jgi:hypothetical protein
VVRPDELDVNPAANRGALPEVPVLRAEHRESSLTRLLEQQTAKIPSDFFLAAALGAMLTSLTLELTDRRKASRFVGMWPGPLLVMGVYNKLVKLLGPR